MCWYYPNTFPYFSKSKRSKQLYTHNITTTNKLLSSISAYWKRAWDVKLMINYFLVFQPPLPKALSFNSFFIPVDIYSLFMRLFYFFLSLEFYNSIFQCPHIFLIQTRFKESDALCSLFVATGGTRQKIWWNTTLLAKFSRFGDIYSEIFLSITILFSMRFNNFQKFVKL